jgi:hypothetical protein
MDEDRIKGVADGGALHLGVINDGGGAFEVSFPVDIGMADADTAGDDRHGGVFTDK